MLISPIEVFADKFTDTEGTALTDADVSSAALNVWDDDNAAVVAGPFALQWDAVRLGWGYLWDAPGSGLTGAFKGWVDIVTLDGLITSRSVEIGRAHV